MNALVRIYPRDWRRRYGAELEQLVARRPLGLGGSVDLIRGALDAHRHPELVDPAAAGAPDALPGVSRQRLADLRVARRLGIAAWAGAVLWLAGWLVAVNGPIVVDVGFSYRDGSAGMPLFLAAAVLLSAGLVGQLIRLPHTTVVARLGALVALVLAPIWTLGPWVLPIGALALAGIVVLALSAGWAGQWGWWAPVAIVAAISAAGVVVWASTWTGDPTSPWNPLTLAVVLLTPLWLAVGATLQRLPRLAEPDGDLDSSSIRVSSAA